MDTIQEQKQADRRAVKPGDSVRLTGSIWINREATVELVEVRPPRVWIIARMTNGLAVMTDGFEVL